MGNGKKMKRYVGIFIFISIIFAGVVPYINSLHNPFIWDEEVMIVENPIIKDWKYIPYIFKTDIFGSPIKPGGFYRPLYMLSFMLNYQFWGLNTAGYHLFNIIFHILNALLLYALTRKMGLQRKTAWLASLLFAIFPINCQAVTLIGGRIELISGVLSLLCFLLFFNAVEKLGVYFLLTIFIFILAIFTKESVLILPFLMLIYSFIFLRNSDRRKAIVLLLSLIGMGIIYCSVRFSILGSPFHKTLSLINEASLFERILTAPRILLTYIAILVFPATLKSEYHFVIHTAKDVYVWLGMPILILIFAVIYRFLKPRRHALFFSCWFLLGLMPYYNLIITLHATLMDHWAYFGSMGFAVLMSMAVFRIFDSLTRKKIRYIVTSLLVLLMLFYIFRIIERNKEWKEPFILYQRDSEREPNSFLLHCNLGVEYFRRGMLEHAKREFIAANEVSPGGGYDVAYNNLGVIYAREGNIQKAIECYKTSIALNNYELAFENLGELYNNLGMHKDAALLLEKGAELYPFDFKIKYQLGVVYYRIGKLDLARQRFKEVNELYGDYLQTGDFLRQIQNRLKASK